LKDIEVLRLDLNHLDPKSLVAFEQLTEPTFRPALHNMEPFNISDTKVIAIGATSHGLPIGLAVVSLMIHIRLATIYSLYVHPAYRQQKVGTRLLALTQEETKKEGAATICLTYPLNEETSDACEKVLATNGWVHKRPFMIRCLFFRDQFPRHWGKKAPQYPPDTIEFFWRDLTPEDRKKLQVMQAQKVIPPSVSPFILENLIEPLNSLGLRRNGEIIGWIITHRIHFDTIRYSSFFILRQYRNLGYAIRLLSDAIDLHLQSTVPRGLLELPLLQVSRTWVQFIRRRLIPHAATVTHINQAWNDVV
jgi:GNAT superfamily N-acetyltransferase